MALSHRLINKGLFHGCKFFIIFSILLISACQPNRYFEPPCNQYCITGERIFSEAWYSCYGRGVACMNGECWDYAMGEFLRALKIKKIDGRWAPTYGMHRLPEYFPNRELGIVYYNLGDFKTALQYLFLSLKQTESAKAIYFINKIRKETLLITQEDKEAPQIFIFPDVIHITAETKITLSGKAVDDTFVANVFIQVNDDESLPLLELSRPLSYSFERTILLRPGINSVSIKVVDLLNNEKEKKIEILCDQEGPMLYFADCDEQEFYQHPYIEGLLYDPSGIKEFHINKKKVELLKIALNEVSEDTASFVMYKFQYPLSSEELAKGVIEYRAEDSLKNSTTGTLSIITKETDHAHLIDKGASFVKLASIDPTADHEKNPWSDLIAMRRRTHSLKIEIHQVPSETFEEEITLQIKINAASDIKEISINDEPVLSMYGVSWAKLFPAIIRRHFEGEKGASCSFQRIINLKEGSNRITIKVLDTHGVTWEKEVHVTRKIRQIRNINERWRCAIPFVIHNSSEKRPETRNKELTFQIIEAFISQERFKIIEFDRLPVVMRERNLYEYIGKSFLGLRKEHTIGIDSVLICYFDTANNSFNLMATLVDLETGEVLVTKDVFEEVDFFIPVEIKWEEDVREHAFNNCCVLAAKFKHYFPLCEGKVLSFSENKITIDIPEKEGLKKGMKLLIFDDQNPQWDFTIEWEARVRDVQRTYSLAELLKDVGIENSPHDTIVNYAVITR